ncbi:MAG: PEGA domain-containing protein [Methanomicrobium sp.]|nr:PEGA domain-containing protein [Methanomicrobium sp.]
MKKLFALILGIGLLFAAAPAGAYTIGGDQSLIIVHCDVEGASVYFDSDYKGAIQNGVLLGYVYTTGTPYKTITVTSNGYIPWTGNMPHPGAGNYADVYATLTPEPTQAPIGGNMGEYIVYCNVDGAQVYFNEDYKGTIAGGELTVPVYVTGTPYTTYIVKKDGYTTFTAQIVEHPKAGETVKLHATLTPVTPVTPATPLSAVSIFAGLVLGILGIAYLAKRE